MSWELSRQGASSLFLLLATSLFCTACQKEKVVTIGEPPPAISGEDVFGKVAGLAQLKGKVVIIYFWTNSCCGGSVKELEPIYRDNKDRGLAVLAINEIDSRQYVHSFAKNNQLSFLMLTDPGSKFLKQYQVYVFPTIFILDKHGIVRKKIQGDIGSARLQKLVQQQFDMQKKAEESYERIHAN
jgi:peroxiredoxin